MLLHHLEQHILGFLGKEKGCLNQEDMIRKYLLGMKEVHNGLECFLVFNQSHELQNVLHGMELKLPGIDLETPSMTYHDQVMSKYPNLVPQQEIQESMVKEHVTIELPLPSGPSAAPQAPPLSQPEMENKKKKKRRSKKDLIPPPLDMKKIKEQEEAVMAGTLPPFPKVPSTPYNEEFNVEQFFQSLTKNQ